MQILSADKLPALFDSVAARMDTVADELCEMDARMGDGDLGLTMRRGFAAVPEFLRETDEPDLGKKLVKAGMKMASIAPLISVLLAPMATSKVYFLSAIAS